MATKTSAALTAPAGVTSIPMGVDVAFFEPGVGIYEKLRVNGEVEIKMPDGSTKKGIVRSLQVGSLIDHIVNYGSRYVTSYGQNYTHTGLVQLLTDQLDGEVLDVTKLYTAVMVAVAFEPSLVPTV